MPFAQVIAQAVADVEPIRVPLWMVLVALVALGFFGVIAFAFEWIVPSRTYRRVLRSEEDTRKANGEANEMLNRQGHVLRVMVDVLMDRDREIRELRSRLP